MAAFGTFVQHQALLHVTVVGVPDGCESLCGKNLCIYIYIYAKFKLQVINFFACTTLLNMRSVVVTFCLNILGKGLQTSKFKHK